VFDLNGNLRSFGDGRSYEVRNRLDRATVLPMDEVATVVVWLAIITAGAIAGIVTDSPWGGIIVAALGIGLCGLLLIRRQPR